MTQTRRSPRELVAVGTIGILVAALGFVLGVNDVIWGMSLCVLGLSTSVICVYVSYRDKRR
jgi:hypothetical protein